MNQIAKDVAKLMSGTVAAQLVAILAAPIITHIFDPGTYGLLGVYIALVSIPIMVSTGRYHVAIVIPKSQDEALQLYLLSLTLTLATALITLLFCSLFGAQLASLVGAPSLADYLWLAPVSVLVRGLFLSSQYYAIRNEKYGAIAISQTIDSLTGSMIIISSGLLMGATAVALIGGRIIGGTISLGNLILRLFHGTHKDKSTAFSFNQIIQVATKYKKFPLVSIWAVLLNTLAYSAPVLMMSIYFTPEVVGFYTLADRVIITPLSIIGGSVAQIFYQRISKLHQSSMDMSDSIIFTLDKLSSVCLFPLLALAVVGEELFAFVFGSQWATAGFYAQILTLYAISRFIVAPIANIASTIGKQEIEVYFNIALFTTRFSAMLIGGLAHNVLLTLILLSVSSIISYVLLLLLICSKIALPIRIIAKNFVINLLKAALPLAILIVGSDVGMEFDWIVFGIVSSALYFGMLYKDNHKIFMKQPL